jgi:hypothetical protein
VLLRPAYANTFALLRLLLRSNHDKDVEILALRHQITVLQRQLGPDKPRFEPTDRALLAALLRRLPQSVLRELRLLVRTDIVLRWHRTSSPADTQPSPDRGAAAGPRTIRSIRALVLRLIGPPRRWPGHLDARGRGPIVAAPIEINSNSLAGVPPTSALRNYQYRWRTVLSASRWGERSV